MEISRKPFLQKIAGVTIGALSLFTSIAIATPLHKADWTSAGANKKNTSHQNHERIINRYTAPYLAVKWQTELDGHISATAAVDDGAVYIPDRGGSLHKLDAHTGQKLWTSSIASFTGVPNDYSRVTPAVGGRVVVLGNQAGRLNQARDMPAGAKVFAVKKNTGELDWITTVDNHPRAVITASPVIHRGVVYVGIASLEEDGDPACCTFRGSVVALSLKSGELLWQTYTVPEGYSGNAVWSSAPVVDKRRNNLYVTTGNNYLIPEDVLQCVTENLGDFNVDDYNLKDRRQALRSVRGCYGEAYRHNWFNSIVALDLDTGKREWVTRTMPFDSWTAACFGGEGVPGCQGGPDYDFGQSPMLYNAKGYENGTKIRRQTLAVGQKSGDFWGLDPDSGKIYWKKKVAPGSVFAGGFNWGAATDGKRIYSGANTALAAGFIPKPWTLRGEGNNGEEIRHGFWSAIDGATGEIIWQVADLNMAGDISRMAVTNGVVFAGSLGTPARAGGAANDPTMFAMNSRTGEILWQFASGGSVISGASIVNGVVYWGSGYDQFGTGTENMTFYAFAPTWR